MSYTGRGGLRCARCLASLSSTNEVSSRLCTSGKGEKVGATESVERLRIALMTGILVAERAVPQLNYFVSREVLCCSV